jgi:hypothetical protein
MASRVLYMGITTCSADPISPKSPSELLDCSSYSDVILRLATAQRCQSPGRNKDSTAGLFVWRAYRIPRARCLASRRSQPGNARGDSDKGGFRAALFFVERRNKVARTKFWP